jgi:hypothetical protein
METFKKYLHNYGHSRVQSFDTSIVENVFECAICIPSCGEGNNIIPLLNSLAKSSQTAKKPSLALLLINSSSKDSHFLVSNLETFECLGADPSKDSHFLKYSSDFSILIVNASHPHERLLKDGVGEARKFLGDLALKLFIEKKIKSPWIRSVDADLEVPEDFLFSDSELSAESTYTYSFKHVKQQNSLVNEATELYDFYLHDYVEGLQFAQSPYDFYALGSILLFHLKNYVNVRGFPSRDAAEDFYFLNKLAKISRIRVLKNHRALDIKSRISDRVPFGTGAAVGKITEMGIYYFYDLKVYIALKEQIQRISTYNETLKWEDLSGPHERFWTAEKIRIERLIKNFKNPKQRLKALHDYFDAFKTLKFVHFLRDHHYPSLAVKIQEAQSFILQRKMDFSYLKDSSPNPDLIAKTNTLT